MPFFRPIYAYKPRCVCCDTTALTPAEIVSAKLVEEMRKSSDIQLVFNTYDGKIDLMDMTRMWYFIPCEHTHDTYYADTILCTVYEVKKEVQCQ